MKGRRRTRYSILFRRLLLRRPPEEGRRIGGFLRPAVHKSTSIIDRVKALARVCVCLCVVRRPLVFSRNEGGGGHTHPPQVGGMWACLNQQDQRAKRETNSPKSSQIFCSLKDKQKLLSFFIPFYQLLFFFFIIIVVIILSRPWDRQMETWPTKEVLAQVPGVEAAA